MLKREYERELKFLSLEGLGASPRNFSKFGCFLLQSRHSLALFQALLIEEFSPNLKYSWGFFLRDYLVMVLYKSLCTNAVWLTPEHEVKQSFSVWCD